MSEKIYVGSGKVIETQYGQMMKLSFTEEDIKTMQENLKNGWINLNLNRRKEPSERGTTHYMTVDTWEPNKGSEKVEPKQAEEITPNDLPF